MFATRFLRSLGAQTLVNSACDRNQACVTGRTSSYITSLPSTFPDLPPAPERCYSAVVHYCPHNYNLTSHLASWLRAQIL